MFYFAIEKEGQLIKNEIRNFHRTLLLHQRLWSELNLNPLELLIKLDILCEILDEKKFFTSSFACYAMNVSMKWSGKSKIDR